MHPNRKFRLPLTVPAIINFVVYVVAGFGPRADDLIDPDSAWHSGFVGMTVFYVEMIYLAVLLLFSIICFKWDEMKRSVTVFLIALRFVLSTDRTDSGMTVRITIPNDEQTSIETELDCVRAYLSLLHIREKITVELASDIRVADFSLPPLTPEAAVSVCEGA